MNRIKSYRMNNLCSNVTKLDSNKHYLSIFIDLLICIGIISIIYAHSLNRPWIFYDEPAIYDETVSPISSSFSETLEVLQTFGITNNLSSNNFLYSSNSVNRINLLGVPIRSFTGLFFDKNSFLYHLFNLILHVLNTCFIFLILKTVFSYSKLINRSVLILLTLLWACHPAHIESILLSTNVNATLSYSIFFILFYDFLRNKDKNNSKLRLILLPFCYLIPMLMNEYIIVLPIILFTYSFYEEFTSNDFKHSVRLAVNKTFPYLVGLFIYLIYFIFSSYKFFQSASYNPIILFFERTFWLFPQIFFHHIKLIFFPKTLSIDQASFVALGKSLYDPYSVFCLVFTIFWIFTPFVLFLKTKNKKTFWLLILSWLFFISTLPFSQFFSPTYCLSAERYLYTPIFFIIFGIAGMLNLWILNFKSSAKYLTVFLLTTIVLLFSARSFLRTYDWQNSVTLIESTIKTSANELYKGFRIKLLGVEILKLHPDETKKSETYLSQGQNCFYKALRDLKQNKNKYSNEPLIIKAYGLDYESLLIKTIHLISFDSFIAPGNSYKKSLKLFNQLSKHLNYFNPSNLELYANLLVKNNEMKRAKEIFLYAYNKFPTNLSILLSLIRFEREFEKNLPATKKYLLEGLKLYPYSAEILFEALRYYQLENNLAEYAKYSYLYGLRTHSKFAYYEALTGFLTLGDLTSSKKTIDKLLQLYSDDPKTLYLSSSYYIKKNDYDTALALLNRAYLSARKGTIEQQLIFDITNTIASLYLALGNTKESSNFANEALKYAKNNPENLVKIKKLVDTIGI